MIISSSFIIIWINLKSWRLNDIGKLQVCLRRMGSDHFGLSNTCLNIHIALITSSNNISTTNSDSYILIFISNGYFRYGRHFKRRNTNTNTKPTYWLKIIASGFTQKTRDFSIPRRGSHACTLFFIPQPLIVLDWQQRIKGPPVNFNLWPAATSGATY